jgi:hypothetical protein
MIASFAAGQCDAQSQWREGHRQIAELRATLRSYYRRSCSDPKRYEDGADGYRCEHQGEGAHCYISCKKRQGAGADPGRNGMSESGHGAEMHALPPSSPSVTLDVPFLSALMAITN